MSKAVGRRAQILEIRKLLNQKKYDIRVFVCLYFCLSLVSGPSLSLTHTHTHTLTLSLTSTSAPLATPRRYDVGVESDALVYDAERAASLEKAKQHYASCRVQGIVRGFLARILTRNLLVEYRAGSLIVKIARGKLGRLRWMLEYVPPSPSLPPLSLSLFLSPSVSYSIHCEPLPFPPSHTD